MIRTLLALVLITLWPALPADAHLMPNTAIYLDFGDDRIEAEILVPVAELEFAAQKRINWHDPAVVRATAASLAARFVVRGDDGRAWRVTLRDAGTADESWAPDIRARLALQPAPGGDPRRFTIAYDAVTDRLPNHFVLLFARSDYRGGKLGGEPAMIGGLQGRGATARIDRGAGSGWAGFRAAIALGMHHIAEGHDHLLFLIALILPAPLLVAGRRWGGYGGGRHLVRGLIAVITAFTIGHSITLIGGAFFGWRLASQPVEIGIALSILISAVHAWRPIFAGREAVVAGGFGLVHGLAFATLIGDYGLDRWQKAQSILGFNLGIEVVQLLVVAAVLPALILLARTPAYPPIRSAGALFAGAAAIAWGVERIAGTANPVAGAIDAGLAQAPWLLAALTLGAVLIYGRYGKGRDPIAAP
ncbi:HupE/UreJ family protein [Sphingomonas sp. 1P06PA]|uniref:HupE/UreJ family protein n=1 Tax=Sphingomonas sp. 1P06PA TaxID=554121 RepID=UPI0039A6FC83